MAKRLYVGNLAYSTTQKDLEELFAEGGPVASASVITDRFSGQSGGFGFVEMASDEDAEAAIQRLDGHNLGGRSIKVNEAREPKRRSEGDSSRSRRGGGGRF
jgi:RNA recognition motif-containing protein